MNIQLAMHSSPRFSTWMWLADWRVLVDAGDGVTQHLGYKIRKIDTVVLTHSHRDHIGGLLQVINQRGEGGSFAVVHPCGSSAFGHLESFANRFNPGTSRNAVWQALEEGDEVQSSVEGRFIKSFRTNHYVDDAPEQAPKSLGVQLIWRKQKVRPQYRHLSQADLDAVRLQLGREGITQPVDEKWIVIGGDGAPVPFAAAHNARLLLHEATFLSAADYDPEDAGDDVGHIHSTVDEALQLAARAGVGGLVLYHISTRYTDAEIRDTVRSQSERLQVPCPVWVALPRRVYWNLLRERPVWEPVG